MFTRILQVLLVLFISFNGYSQAKQRKADTHFAKLEYFYAAPIYSELAKSTISGKGKVNWENVRKAAISNKNIFQYNKARYYYSKLHETNRLTEEDYVEYIDLLRVIGKYDVAEELLVDASNVYPANNFVQLLKDKNKNFQHLLADTSIYFIEPLSINSGLGDFCPAFYQKGIYVKSEKRRIPERKIRLGQQLFYQYVVFVLRHRQFAEQTESIERRFLFKSA